MWHTRKHTGRRMEVKHNQNRLIRKERATNKKRKRGLSQASPSRKRKGLGGA